jgi:hypothetical protein
VEKIQLDDDKVAGRDEEQPMVQPPPPSREPDPVVTAARLMLGAASLGLEAFGSRLKGWADEPVTGKNNPETESGQDYPSVADTMLGVAAWGARTAASLEARGAELAKRGVRTAERTTEAVGRLVPDFLNEPIDRLRERAQQRFSRLGAAGREELERSRAIARDAVAQSLDALIGRLADSRELQLVIRTQSVTAGEEAVDSIRDQTARIDDRLEGAARKLIRRRPRPPATAPR